MKPFLYLLLIYVIFFYSCKPEDDSNRIVLAGVKDSGMDYHEFNPPFQISLKVDTLKNISYGEDSLDIDLDGNYDLIISQRNLLNGNTGNGNANDIYPFCRLTVSNGLELATKKETYYIGLGQTSSINWVDTIAYKTDVYKIQEWSATNTVCSMWVVPPTIFWGSNGTWFNLISSEKYVAIRIKYNSHYKYGWIKIHQISREQFSIPAYALEK